MSEGGLATAALTAKDHVSEVGCGGHLTFPVYTIYKRDLILVP